MHSASVVELSYAHSRWARMRFASDLRKKIIDDYYLCSCSRVVWRSLPNGMPSNGFPQRRESRQSNGAGAAGYERFWCRPVPTPWWWVGALGNAGDYLKLHSIKGVRYTWLSYSWLHPELTMKRSLLPDGWATVCAVCRAPVGENATVNLGSSRLTSCSGSGVGPTFRDRLLGTKLKFMMIQTISIIPTLSCEDVLRPCSGAGVVTSFRGSRLPAD